MSKTWSLSVMNRSFCLTSAAALALVAVAAAPAFAQDDSIGSWTGPYAGVNFGFGGGAFSYPYAGTTDSAGTSPAEGRLRQNSSGVMGGVTLGYNYEMRDGLLVGLETDFDGTGVNANAGFSNFDTTGPSSGSIQSRIDYLGTVRGRVGKPLFNNRFVPYITGGFAYGGVRTSDQTSTSPGGANPTGFISPTQVQTGWTVGGGAEYALNRHLSFKAEYLYVDLSQASLGNTGGTFTGPGFTLFNANVAEKTDANIVRVGLNWHF
jgi:outer membrane immunogenic protein